MPLQVEAPMVMSVHKVIVVSEVVQVIVQVLMSVQVVIVAVVVPLMAQKVLEMSLVVLYQWW